MKTKNGSTFMLMFRAISILVGLYLILFALGNAFPPKIPAGDKQAHVIWFPIPIMPLPIWIPIWYPS